MMPAKDSIWGMTPNRALAKQLAVRDIPSLVYDAVNLEGVAMSLPEVQTLLDGITVGGHKISDQNMAIHQADTWRHLLALIENENFTFSKAIALELHSIAGKDEALNWGAFRTGNVTIGGTDYEPPDPEKLDDLWLEVESEISKITDIYDRAIAVFLKMARAQFFWDVNKRMGRFMMNGILLSNGYPIINVPVKRKQEFNQLMLDYYSTGAMSAMNEFARSCLNAKIINNFK
ncbi:MAG: Fic family protein [SAR324 cluster bacterium]|nr:Fic family protein [SAR324 cluster bacterium]